MRSYCQSFDHDVNSCPYYDVFDESYARLNAMIKTINEQHEHFVSEVREFGLLCETEPSLAFLRFEASLYDDCEYFLLLKSNFINYAFSTSLEDVFELPLTSFLYVAPFFLGHLLTLSLLT